jgi:hypothetical protein
MSNTDWADRDADVDALDVALGDMEQLIGDRATSDSDRAVGAAGLARVEAVRDRLAALLPPRENA